MAAAGAWGRRDGPKACAQTSRHRGSEQAPKTDSMRHGSDRARGGERTQTSRGFGRRRGGGAVAAMWASKATGEGLS
jgi:hypothetical protein